MKQKYTKNNDKTTDIYNDNLFFDNDLYESEGNLPQFNLERLARHAAQQVIQHAVEMEVSEFLEREKYAKTAAEDFRGYRNGHHKQRTISTSFGRRGSQSSASLGYAAKVSIKLGKEIQTTLGRLGSSIHVGFNIPSACCGFISPERALAPGFRKFVVSPLWAKIFGRIPRQLAAG